jgi:Flp pilus assembly protein CpaB
MPGRAGRPRRMRPVPLGAVLPVALAVAAAGSAYVALAQRGARAPVAVAASYLPAGTVLGPADVRDVLVASNDRALVKGLVPPSQVPYGWVTAVGVPAGQPLSRDLLSAPAGSGPLGRMSIPVPQSQAVGGALVAGDLVDVVLASPGGSRYVATGLRVAGTSGAQAGSLVGGPVGYYVVVEVDRATALRVASALAAATGASGDQVELVRSTGEAPVASQTVRARGLPRRPGPGAGAPRGGRRG